MAPRRLFEEKLFSLGKPHSVCVNPKQDLSFQIPTRAKWHSFQILRIPGEFQKCHCKLTISERKGRRERQGERGRDNKSREWKEGERIGITGITGVYK